MSPALRVMRPSEDETGGCAYLEESCVLYCRIGDLKADLENQDDVEWDEHESTGCVEKRDHWRWLFSGKPFDEECASHRCSLQCWQEKLQSSSGTPQGPGSGNKPTAVYLERHASWSVLKNTSSRKCVKVSRIGAKFGASLD